mmetsp:Transcript_49359/g.158596  ORF Transcript_49359/g.158596 Transcript_49359/m.158596 type:complete len:227 (+) Transcript_49359:953-1633(+)
MRFSSTTASSTREARTAAQCGGRSSTLCTPARGTATRSTSPVRSGLFGLLKCSRGASESRRWNLVVSFASMCCVRSRYRERVCGVCYIQIQHPHVVTCYIIYVSRCIFSHKRTELDGNKMYSCSSTLRPITPNSTHPGRARRSQLCRVIERVHAAQRASVAAVHKTQRSPAACVLLVTQSCSWPWACPSRAAAAGWTRRRGGSSRHRRSRTPTTRRATSCTRGPAA